MGTVRGTLITNVPAAGIASAEGAVTLAVAPLRLAPFFSYAGSKQKLAAHYPRPEHRTIIEPFGGSAGYSLNYWDRKVLIYDINPYVAGLWRYLINASVEEILAIPLLEQGQTTDDLPVCQEARWLVGFWISKAGTDPKKRPTRWAKQDIVDHNHWEKRNGRLVWVRERINKPYNRWSREVRARIASQVPAIRHWEVREQSYLEAPDEVATWFVDPPYQSLADMYGPPPDFEELAGWCQSRRGLTVVCEEQGADWLPFKPLVARRSAMKRRRSVGNVEMVWVNRR